MTSSPLRSIRSTILLLSGVFALAILTGTAHAQASGAGNGVHTQGTNTANAPHSNAGHVPGVPVQRERQPFPEPATDDEARKRRHATAALNTILAQRDDEVRRRVANGELEAAVLESLGDAPTLESILAQGDKPQFELLKSDTEKDALGRPLFVVPTPEQVRLAGYVPEAIDRVIQDAKDARELQITEADAAKARLDAAGPEGATGSPGTAGVFGGGASAASAATFAAAGGAENLSSTAGQKAAADEKTSSPAPATGA